MATKNQPPPCFVLGLRTNHKFEQRSEIRPKLTRQPCCYALKENGTFPNQRKPLMLKVRSIVEFQVTLWDVILQYVYFTMHTEIIPPL
jgi:hypothetical protein